MNSLQHTKTLFYYDGPQIFEARDCVGGHYIAVMVESDDGQDQYLAAEVELERLQQFRCGMIDLRSLLTGRGQQAWFLAKANGSFDTPLALQPQVSALAASPYLPEPGFLLYDSHVNAEASLNSGGTPGAVKQPISSTSRPI